MEASLLAVLNDSERLPVTPEPTGDRALRSPASEKERATVRASGARWQAKRDGSG
jgi:hypothetical protein